MTADVVRAEGVGRWGLAGVDLAVAPGELVAVTGPSLSGKTTLVELLAGWDRPDTGTVRWDGGAAPPPWSYVAVVPQAFALLEELSVIENIELARRFHRSGDRAVGHSDELLARLGLDRLRHRGAFEVSVGERQRAMVARALADRPRLVLADEPVAHQDERHAGIVGDLLAEAAADGAAVVIATRDPDLVTGATRTVRLAEGGGA
jgi:putative ABC transport system ATP-binding protein